MTFLPRHESLARRRFSLAAAAVALLAPLSLVATTDSASAGTGANWSAVERWSSAVTVQPGRGVVVDTGRGGGGVPTGGTSWTPSPQPARTVVIPHVSVASALAGTWK
jgi:hypothetical protein